eukprot:TRINITY_DN1664_c0_g2_i14.p1 TRINITY_DN1664_c0_g2~~TRINITY_DN1664_c0_g2_i14.p1  ORF type:complete len:339 (+),score=54.82 TRINITY_DN1664_c0_g2_i14:77-1093(+)
MLAWTTFLTSAYNAAGSRKKLGTKLEEEQTFEGLMMRRGEKHAGNFMAVSRKPTEILEVTAQKGLSFNFQNTLRNNFVTIHCIEIGKESPKAMMMGNQKPDDKGSYTFMALLNKDKWQGMAKMGSQVSETSVAYQGNPFSATLISQMVSRDPTDPRNHLELECTAKAFDVIAQMRFINFAGLLLSYSQQTTERLTLGSEVLFTLEDRTQIALLGSYKEDNGNTAQVEFANRYGTPELTCSYVHNVLPHFNFAVQSLFSLEKDRNSKMKQWNSLYTVGYQYLSESSYPTMSVKSTLDSKLKVKLSMNTPLTEIASVNVSSSVDLLNSDVDLGVGLSVMA